MSLVEALHTEHLDIFGKQRSPLQWNGGNRRWEVLITNVWDAESSLAFLAGSFEAAICKKTNISNRPFCILTNSFVSKQAAKASTVLSRSLTHREPWRLGWSNRFLQHLIKVNLEELWIQTFYVLVWLVILTLLDRRCKFLLSLEVLL